MILGEPKSKQAAASHLHVRLGNPRQMFSQVLHALLSVLRDTWIPVKALL